MIQNDLKVEVVKHSGERAYFSLEKLRNSLRHSGAEENLVVEIAASVQHELFPGITTKEIYNRAFSLLKKRKGALASRYKLKKAIYELGPTGFPFEKFVGSLLFYSGYQVQTGLVLQGKCITHEVDIVAHKKDRYVMGECKFHSDEGRNCNVKVPLYIHSRYQDIFNFNNNNSKINSTNEGWVITNTRFSQDAISYGECVGLSLLSWDFPKGDGLKDRIDRLGLYPITVSTLLTKREKQFLISRDVVLCRQLIDDVFYLDHLGISEIRKQKILNEIELLCKSQ